MIEEMSLRIQDSIKRRAESYTREWRFDPENPDIGSALAIVFAEMAAGTIKRFSKIPMKNRIAFLNELNAGLLPAVPSHGYVQFLLINEEAEGTVVKAGTMVTASDDSQPDGQVSFETEEDVYVTPAVLSDVYQTNDTSDKIYCLYDRQKGDWKPISLFLAEGTNLQRHVLYFSHNCVFGIHSEADIGIAFLKQGDVFFEEEELEILADEGKAVFEYYSAQGWMKFASHRITKEGLVFHKEKIQPEFVKTEIEGSEGCWVRCRVWDFHAFSGMHFERIELSAWNKGLLPDTVFGALEECDRHGCFPFGERLDLYQEVYFGSEEVLSKKGAWITFSFGIRFEKIPLSTENKQDVEWDWIMKQSDLRREEEFEITIESVVWEYYNGTGWKKLPAAGGQNHYDRVFSVGDKQDGSYRTLNFICPDDIETVLVNAVETYYIRARILKINNLYKWAGNYVIPFIDQMTFRYCYPEQRPGPQKYIFSNNLENRCLEGKQREKNSVIKPFFQTGLENTGVYFGFEVLPVGSPVKMLLCLAGEKDRSRQHLLWEYWNGKKWKNINPVDGTEHLSRTGIVTFSGNPDMEKKMLFGRERAWIRIRWADWTQDRQADSAMLQKICMNAVPVRHIYRREREYFQMEVYQEDKSFSLLEKNIFEVKVYVNEQGHLSEGEMHHLKQENSVFVSKEQEEVWVRWKQVFDFQDSGPSDRHYVIEPSDGKLLFGDGKHGKIPYPARTENICIDYCCGGGTYTNLPEGKIDKMDTYTGYINKVTNPLPMTGGCDTETVEEAVHRMSAMIRHQNRAVSARDYEELAMCASRKIQRVRCFSGYDGEGMPSGGAVTLVVLQKQFRKGQMQFTELKETILQYMKDKISAALPDSGKLFIVPPRMVEVRLRIELCVENFDKVFQVKREILKRLEQFLEPEDGKGQTGLNIGHFPNIMQIRNTISGIKGIAYIKNIMMSAYTADAMKKTEVDIDLVRKGRYVLPVNGEHEIIIDVD